MLQYEVLFHKRVIKVCEYRFLSRLIIIPLTKDYNTRDRQNCWIIFL